ncbi:neutral/alkaline non-lysosomal ceramidase N-terminal domain-containing protein, partial [Saccharothrix sp. MB29]|nr:neutral/alkaline non-lysosomal ceramidase N-terminal domain-containing protein [Saccharothrix sp. MB29]
MVLDVHRLRLLREVQRLGTLAAVARALSYSPSAISQQLAQLEAEAGVPLENVLVQGYANDYAQYVTTPEEYDLQQYEGGSTLFGRNTLPAYEQEFGRLAASLRTGAALPPGPTPGTPPFTGINLQTGVVFDDKPIGTSFGQVRTEPAASYTRGQTA